MRRHFNLRVFAAVALLLTSALLLRPAQGEVISHWSFDTNFSDSSGNGNNGTAMNGASVSSAQSAFGGSALYLDAYDTEGTNNQQHVVVPNPGIQTSSFTIAAWVRPETLEHDWTDIFGYWSSSGDNDYPFAFYLRDDNRVHAYMRPDGNIGAISTSSTYTLLDTWNHVAVTWDRTAKEMRIYVNGEQAAYKASTATNVDMQAAVSPWTIGRKDDTGRPYDGYIDELWVFDEALSADEVNQLKNVNVVPEPSTITLLLLGGLVGLCVYRRKQR